MAAPAWEPGFGRPEGDMPACACRRDIDFPEKGMDIPVISGGKRRRAGCSEKKERGKCTRRKLTVY